MRTLDLQNSGSRVAVPEGVMAHPKTPTQHLFNVGPLSRDGGPTIKRGCFSGCDDGRP